MQYRRKLHLRDVAARQGEGWHFSGFLLWLRQAR